MTPSPSGDLVNFRVSWVFFIFRTFPLQKRPKMLLFRFPLQKHLKWQKKRLWVKTNHKIHKLGLKPTPKIVSFFVSSLIMHKCMSPHHCISSHIILIATLSIWPPLILVYMPCIWEGVKVDVTWHWFGSQVKFMLLSDLAEPSEYMGGTLVRVPRVQPDEKLFGYKYQAICSIFLYHFILHFAHILRNISPLTPNHFIVVKFLICSKEAH